jgi:nucleotide-binding universal stress UspA family protein
MSTYPQPVVVGVDGSPPAEHALGFAAAEAAAGAMPLRIVHAVSGGAAGIPDAVVEAARARAAEHYPYLRIETRIAAGRAAPTLIEESTAASLTVVGCRGLGGLGALLTGSVSARVATHGHGRVAVVRGRLDARMRRPVLVGVDGWADSTPALEFALRHAALHRLPVRAMCVWEHTAISELGEVAPYGYGVAEVEELTRAQLAAVLRPWRARYPAVRIEPLLVHSRHPAAKLVAATADAGVVVVGCRERGELRGALLGSVGHALVHGAQCPVVIVHSGAMGAAGAPGGRTATAGRVRPGSRVGVG